MTTYTSQSLTQPIFNISLGQIRRWMVWLMFASSFFVTFEPAPVEMLFALVVLCFLKSGLQISVAILPMVILLVLYNIGGALSLTVGLDMPKAVTFVAVSFYMAVTAIFFACYVAYAPVERMAVIKGGMVFAATLSAIIGMAGYFQILGLGELATVYGRAIGFFKDPNVFSTFLILPAIMLINGLILGTERRPLLSAICLLIIMGGIFLAFSRGAWINFVMSVFLLVVLTFTLSGTPRLRSRIFVLSLVGFVASAILLAILLSIPEVRDLFLDRFTLIKNYDAGEKGRFGNQLNSIPMLLDRPLGFGPRSYSVYFNLDPHNVYINAFASYGWLGGVSYIVLLICTLIIGFKTILMRSPWQRHAIVVFCPLVSVIFQGVQIDTDHWRHFYWMLGMMWGLFAASLQPALVRQSEKTVASRYD